ncbi:MAG TPA: ATPase, T2SS/T4P/T4SS family [Thermoanaerobaculia bacterium]|jgi:type IV secretion system protein VirB11|nr:ATPase, T2SS/T4P/T4SS family [Thermoanaerobaculia bacterium]
MPGEDFAAIRRNLPPGFWEALADPHVTELYVNGAGRLWLEVLGKGRTATEVEIPAHGIQSFLFAMAARENRELNDRAPELAAQLPEALGFCRLQGLVPPLVREPSFVLRKPASLPLRLDDYVRQGMLSAEQLAAIHRALAERLNLLVVGGTRSGKTTLASAILAELATVAPADRLVVLEDTPELSLPSVDVQYLRTSPTHDLQALLRLVLRLAPDRIIVGEVRGSEALALLDAWSTGHPGGIATLHANDAAGALHRLDRLAQRNNVPSQLDLIASAVDLVLVLRGGSARRELAESVRVGDVVSGTFQLTSWP